MLTHDEFINELLSDPAVKAEYDALEDEFNLLRDMIKARNSAGLSQSDVAKKMGTKQSAVARIEGAGQPRHSPSLTTLRRYAEAVGCHLEIKLTPNPQHS